MPTKIIKSKKVITGSILIISIILTSLFIYSFFIEPNWIEITHTKIKISSNIDSNLSSCKLLVISDIHAASEEHEKFLKDVVNEINKISENERIDAIIIAGDMIDYKSDEIKFLEPLKDIKHRKIYAVLGNHDYGKEWNHKEIADKVEEYMEGLGIDVLRNENRVICEKIRIIGIDCLWSGRYDLDKAFAVNEGNVSNLSEILISHNPDIVYVMDDKHPDLIISGHTHGGQVKFPFIGPISMPSKAGKVCPEGLCKINGYKIYITRGIGGNPRIRFLSRPEISIIELM